MRYLILILLLVGGVMADTQYNKLSKEEEYVILNKGTERPWTGDLLENKKPRPYI